MSCTLYGAIADDIGATWWTDDVAVARVDGRLIVERRHRFATLAMTEFRSVQPHRIGVDIDHRGAEIGEVVYLERSDQTLTAVVVLEHVDAGDLEAFGPAKLSTLTARDRVTGDVELRGLAVVKPDNAASVGLGPIRFIPGDIRRSALDLLPITGIPAVLQRARDSDRRRRHSDPLRIVEHRSASDVTRLPYGGYLIDGELATARPAGTVVEWSAPYAGIIDVR